MARKKDTDRRIQTMREYMVVKDNKTINEIIRLDVNEQRYSLSTLEQKALSYILSMIQPPENITSPMVCNYTFDIQDFCKVCGIDEQSGGNYQTIKKALQGLASHGFWLTQANGSKIYFQWITTPEFNPNTGKITVTIPEKVMPYLYDLSGNFTEYALYQILRLGSSYSIPLYEYFKCNCYKHKIQVGIKEFKRYLGIADDAYKEYKNLRRRVIEPSLKEINIYTDLKVECEPMRNGRSYTDLIFRIKQKDQVETLDAYERVMIELNGGKYDKSGQLSLYRYM